MADQAEIERVASKLTEAQRVELERLCDLSLPNSFRKRGFTGFPQRCVDLRPCEALERRRLAKASVHSFNMGNGWRTEIQWHATPLGLAVRAHLLQQDQPR